MPGSTPRKRDSYTKRLRRGATPKNLTTRRLGHIVREIQRIWRVEQGDWHNSALSLYRDVAGVDLEADGDDLGAFGGAEQSELEAACGLHGLPYPLVARALEAEASAQGMAKRHGIHGRIAALLDEEWADDMEAAAEDEAERRRQAGEI